MRSRIWSALALTVAVLLSAGCSSGSSGAKTVAGPIRVTSPAFTEGGLIPANFTCVADGVSPPLGWTARPAGTREWAVVLVDTDVANGGFVHWVVTGVKPSLASFVVNALPAGAVTSRTSANRAGYVGLCPPSGHVHHYTITVYALRQPLKLTTATATADALAAIHGAAIASGTLTGHFAR